MEKIDKNGGLNRHENCSWGSIGYLRPCIGYMAMKCGIKV
jgi:hypothetical protein